MSARYWIAQHVEDLFRNEPRNVGVFVRCGDGVVARFFGEDTDGDVDGRKIRGLPYPDVYKQWVSYWRREVLAGKPIDGIATSSTSNYRVITGGEVSDVGTDSPSDVANYLYSVLVSEGGFMEATVGELPDAPNAVQLSAEVSDALDARQLLIRDERAQAPVAHPVRRNVRLNGKVATYRPAFTQQNGTLYIMETVDFSRAKKTTARDHAGWSAYMFRDLRQSTKASEALAIIKMSEADQEVEEVRTGLALLKNESDLVNWSDEVERARFLEDRRRIAVA
jgi:hypothetical protein